METYNIIEFKKIEFKVVQSMKIEYMEIFNKYLESVIFKILDPRLKGEDI